MSPGRAWLLGTVLLAVTGCVESGAGRSAPPATQDNSSSSASPASPTRDPVILEAIDPDDASVAAPPPAKAASRSRVPVLLLVGSAIVMGHVGALLLIGAESRQARAYRLGEVTNRTCLRDDPAPEGLCAEQLPAQADADRMGNLGIGMLIASGLLGAGAGVYLLFPEARPQDPKLTPNKAVRLVPFAGTGSAGAVLQGSF